ncbi:unnamed protein product [Brassica oleracea]|uniref:RRM domain-containing protein n=3 Tax=Brassica TaxID=3705 RepID=A0A0D3DFF5_BRAOL|nr:unnamed protein product [Brassica napus]VDD40132.1 unnamed protein product [Brassica oleracea]
MSDGLFRRNRPLNQLDGFYTEWSKHLTERCLPPLLIFPSDAKNDAVLGDIRAYYDTLDHYANKNTILYFLLPSWRSNSLETPILLLGDINPRLFTSLVQSLVDGLDQDPIGTYGDLAASWEDLSSELGNTINETVSRLLGEMREAQDGFIRRFSDKWVSSFLPSQSGTVIMETATSVTTTEDCGAIMEELVRIYCEANQLRKSTITDIAGLLNMNQRALFLESVCKLLAGFKHQDQAFQNSLFDNHLIRQPMMQQHDAPRRPPPNHHLFRPTAPSGFAFPRQINHPLPPGFYQVFRPFAPSGEVFAHPRPFAPQRPPPPMNHHQQDHVIYVGNLAPEATDDLLLEQFSRRYHSARVARICFDETSGSTYGFVSFADEREKWDAMKVMNRKFFLDREMHIGHAANNSI